MCVVHCQPSQSRALLNLADQGFIQLVQAAPYEVTRSELGAATLIEPNFRNAWPSVAQLTSITVPNGKVQ